MKTIAAPVAPSRTEVPRSGCITISAMGAPIMAAGIISPPRLETRSSGRS